MRTRMTESPKCIPALVVSRCTLHNLKLIEAAYHKEKVLDGRFRRHNHYHHTHSPVKKKLLLNRGTIK